MLLPKEWGVKCPQLSYWAGGLCPQLADGLGSSHHLLPPPMDSLQSSLKLF